MEAARIVVVDDESGVRSLVVAIPTNEGYTVRQAADAQRAMLSCENESYDLVAFVRSAPCHARRRRCLSRAPEPAGRQSCRRKRRESL